MSTTKFNPMDFRDKEIQSERTIKGSSSYFLAVDIPRNEMGDTKKYRFKEGTETVDGLDVNLETIGKYFLYVRAVIADKVFLS